MSAKKSTTQRRKPVQMTMPEDVRATLARVGNASDYVSRMVSARRREWGEALHWLEADGWERSELRVACAALGGAHHPFGESLPDWVEAQLRRVVPAGRSKQAWSARCGKVQAEPVARGLAVLAREWWAGNDELVAELGG